MIKIAKSINIQFPFVCSDTCHFQKLQDDGKTNEFDFHWNTSPSSIVCAFPYIIAFTTDSIEIRLVVNGNLVHTATMPELQLISSKRDIYFATTAPEFIPKDFRIGCFENEQIQESTNRRPSRLNEFSNERILEIRHKIDKIEAQQQRTDFSEFIGRNAQSKSIAPQIERLDPPMHINTDDSFSKFLPLPRTDQLPSFQRARSFRKPKEKHLNDEQKRLISKSNSCGDPCVTNEVDHEFPLTRKSLNEPTVPPNSPKVNSLSHSPNSPIIRLLKSPNNTKLNYFTSSNADNNQSLTAEKLKPLRIFRIPLFNLTGTHSHYHIHNSAPKVAAKKPPRKIEEDGFESAESLEDNDTSTNGIPIDNKQNCEIKQLPTNLQRLSTNCTNLSLFSSI